MKEVVLVSDSKIKKQKKLRESLSPKQTCIRALYSAKQDQSNQSKCIDNDTPSRPQTVIVRDTSDQKICNSRVRGRTENCENKFESTQSSQPRNQTYRNKQANTATVLQELTED